MGVDVYEAPRGARRKKVKDLTKANPHGIVRVLRLTGPPAGTFGKDKSGNWWTSRGDDARLGDLTCYGECDAASNVRDAAFAQYGVDIPQLADYEITKDANGDCGILHKPKNGFAPFGPGAMRMATRHLYDILAGDPQWKQLAWIEYVPAPKPKPPYEIVQDRNGVWGIKVGGKFAGFTGCSEEVRKTAEELGISRWAFSDWNDRKPLPAPEPVIQVPLATAIDWEKSLGCPVSVLRNSRFPGNEAVVARVQAGLRKAIQEAGG